MFDTEVTPSLSPLSALNMLRDRGVKSMIFNGVAYWMEGEWPMSNTGDYDWVPEGMASNIIAEETQWVGIRVED